MKNNEKDVVDLRGTDLRGADLRDMTIAERMKASFLEKVMNWDELLCKADRIGVACEQDWKYEVTCFELSDGSIIKFLGKSQEIRAYRCNPE